MAIDRYNEENWSSSESEGQVDGNSNKRGSSGNRQERKKKARKRKGRKGSKQEDRRVQSRRDEQPNERVVDGRDELRLQLPQPTGESTMDEELGEARRASARSFSKLESASFSSPSTSTTMAAAVAAAAAAAPGLVRQRQRPQHQQVEEEYLALAAAAAMSTSPTSAVMVQLRKKRENNLLFAVGPRRSMGAAAGGALGTSNLGMVPVGLHEVHGTALPMAAVDRRKSKSGSAVS